MFNSLNRLSVRLFQEIMPLLSMIISTVPYPVCAFVAWKLHAQALPKGARVINK